MATNKRLIKSNDEAAGGASFNTVTYIGNGGTNPITDVGFQPDFVWLKCRNVAKDHRLYDSVRGVTNFLESNNTDAEAAAATSLTSFDTNGFTLGAATTTNSNGDDFVAWCWKAGGAAVTNTDGTITSQVSANTEAGFSIVSYTGNASYGQTVGHGLDSAPEIVIFKNLSDLRNWRTYAEPLGATKYINLDESAESGIFGSFNNTPPTTDVFSTTNADGDRATNYNGDRFIAYCFHSVAGFSKFGSYVGNGNVVGDIIDCGFEPAFVMIKSSTITGSWRIWDNKRSPSNPRNEILKPNESDAEETNSPNAVIDFLENGFQPKSTHSSVNQNGATYIYMAFANQF